MTKQHSLNSTPSHEFSLIGLAETAQLEAIQSVLDSIRQTNDRIRAATEVGVSIELIRTSRLHNGQGHWGDQIAPAVRQSSVAGV